MPASCCIDYTRQTTSASCLHAGTKPPLAAVFYSISSTQKGLAGVDLGNFLIKQVRS